MTLLTCFYTNRAINVDMDRVKDISVLAGATMLTYKNNDVDVVLEPASFVAKAFWKKEGTQ